MAAEGSDDIPLWCKIPAIFTGILAEESTHWCRHLVFLVAFGANYRVPTFPIVTARNVLTVNRQIRAARTGKPKLYEFTFHDRILSHKMWRRETSHAFSSGESGDQTRTKSWKHT